MRLRPSPGFSGGRPLFQGLTGVLLPGTVILSPAQGPGGEPPWVCLFGQRCVRTAPRESPGSGEFAGVPSHKAVWAFAFEQTTTRPSCDLYFSTCLFSLCGKYLAGCVFGDWSNRDDHCKWAAPAWPYIALQGRVVVSGDSRGWHG